jgi:hypothetical protein
LHRAKAKPPAHDSPCGCQVRVDASLAVEVRLCRPTRGWQALLRQSASERGHPRGGGSRQLVPTAAEVRLCSSKHAAVRFVPRALAPFRRVRTPAAPGFGLVRSGGREGSAAGACSCSRALDARDGSCRRMPRSPCAVWFPDLSGLGSAGSGGVALAAPGACSR